MKKFLLILLSISCIMLSGCFNYKDINRVLFITSVVIDVDKDKRPVIYLEAFKPFRSTDKGSEKGQKIMYKGSGKTVFQAIRDTNLTSSYKLNFTQNKALIFTEKAAEYGIDNFLDFFDRDQEALIRPYVAVYVGDPEALMKAKIKEEDYIGLFLAELFQNQGAASRAVQLPMHEYLRQRYIGSKVNVVTVIELKKDQLEDKIEVNGGAVIRNDKLLTLLPKDEGESYNFLVDNVRSGTLEEINPSSADKFVTLEIRNSKTKTRINYENKRIKVNKTINVKTSFAEANGNINLNESEIQEIQKEAEKSIQVQCMTLFNKYKTLGVDIFNIKEQFQRKYPNEHIENVMHATDFNIKVNVSIMGSSDIKEYFK